MEWYADTVYVHYSTVHLRIGWFYFYVFSLIAAEGGGMIYSTSTLSIQHEVFGASLVHAAVYAAHCTKIFFYNRINKLLLLKSERRTVASQCRRKPFRILHPSEPCIAVTG